MSQSKPILNKIKYWTGVLYPENMIENWEDEIDDILQIPYAYCKHNADLTSKDGEERKEHIHIIVVFPNTTTYQHAFNVLSLLSAEGKKALSTCKAVINIRHIYDYLIHDTRKAKEQGKHLYSAEERITGNNFDIGAYEQLSLAEKNDICRELANVIRVNGITNFMDLFVYVADECEDSAYFDVLKSNASFLSALCKGMYLKISPHSLL